MKQKSLLLILFTLAMVAGCVPSDEFLTDQKKIKSPGLELPDNPLDVPDLIDEEPTTHALTFDEMVQYMQVRLNNNYLDSGKMASFTVQAPFSEGDGLKVYTESNCQGEPTDLGREEFSEIDLSSLYSGSSDAFNEFVDDNSEFFKNIGAPKPKVNRVSANYLTPYEVKLPGVREGVYTYSFRFYRGAEVSRCLSFSGMEHIVKRDKPRGPRDVEVIGQEDTMETPVITSDDKDGALALRVIGDYIGENVVGLFMPEEGVPANKACDLEHLVLAKPLEFTPGIRIDLELAKEKFMEEIRGDIHFYTAFVNPHGMVSDCFGPLTINYVGPPDDPEVYFAYSEMNPEIILFDEENQKYWGSSDAVEFFVQLDFNQSTDVVSIHNGDDCMGDPDRLFPQENEETLLSHTYEMVDMEITKSAKVTNQLIMENNVSSCASATFEVDENPPMISDVMISPGNASEDCSIEMIEAQQFTNCEQINISFNFKDNETHQTFYSVSNDMNCMDSIEIEPEEFYADGSGEITQVQVSPEQEVFLYSRDLFGNSNCQKIIERVRPLPEISLWLLYIAGAAAVKGPVVEEQPFLFNVDLVNNDEGLSYPAYPELASDEAENRYLITRGAENYYLISSINSQPFNNKDEKLKPYEDLELYEGIGCTDGNQLSLLDASNKYPIEWDPTNPPAGFPESGMDKFYCLKIWSVFEEKKSYAYMANDITGPQATESIKKYNNEDCILQADYSNCANLVFSLDGIIDEKVGGVVDAGLSHKVQFRQGVCPPGWVDYPGEYIFMEENFSRNVSSSLTLSADDYSGKEYCAIAFDRIGNWVDATYEITFPEKVDLLNESALSLTINNGNNFRVLSPAERNSEKKGKDSNIELTVNATGANLLNWTVYVSDDCTGSNLGQYEDLTKNLSHMIAGDVEGEYHFSVKGVDAFGNESSCLAAHKAVYLLDKSHPSYDSTEFSKADGDDCVLNSSPLQTNCDTLELSFENLEDLDPSSYDTSDIFNNASNKLSIQVFDTLYQCEIQHNNPTSLEEGDATGGILGLLGVGFFNIHEGSQLRTLSVSMKYTNHHDVLVSHDNDGAFWVLMEDDVKNKSICTEINSVPDYIAPITKDIVLKFSDGSLDEYVSSFVPYEDGESKKGDKGPIFDNTGTGMAPYNEADETTHPTVSLKVVNSDDSSAYNFLSGHRVALFNNKDCSDVAVIDSLEGSPFDAVITKEATTIIPNDTDLDWLNHEGERYFSAKIITDLEPDGGNCSAVLFYNDNEEPSYADIDMLASDSPGCTLSGGKTQTNCENVKFSVSNFNDASDATVYFVKIDSDGNCLGFSDDDADGVFDDENDDEAPDINGANILFSSGKSVDPFATPITTEIAISELQVGVQMLDEYGNFKYFPSSGFCKVFDLPVEVQPLSEQSLSITNLEVQERTDEKFTGNFDPNFASDPTNEGVDKVSFHLGLCSNQASELRGPETIYTYGPHAISTEGEYNFSSNLANELETDCDELTYIYDETPPVITASSVSNSSGDCTLAEDEGVFTTSCDELTYSYTVTDALNDFCQSLGDDCDPADTFNEGEGTTKSVTETVALALGENTVTVSAKDRAGNEATTTFTVTRINKPVLNALLKLETDYGAVDTPFGPINSPLDYMENFYTGNHDDIKIKVYNDDGSSFTSADLSNADDTLRIYANDNCSGGVNIDTGNDFEEELTVSAQVLHKYSMDLENILGEKSTCVQIDYPYMYDTTDPVPTVASYYCDGVPKTPSTVNGKDFIECSTSSTIKVDINAGENLNKVSFDSPDLGDPNTYLRKDVPLEYTFSADDLGDEVSLEVVDAAGNMKEIEILLFAFDYNVSVTLVESPAPNNPIAVQLYDAKPGLDIEVKVHNGIIGVDFSGATVDYTPAYTFWDSAFLGAKIQDYPGGNLVQNVDSVSTIVTASQDPEDSDYIIFKTEVPFTLDISSGYYGNDALVPYDRYYIEPTFTFELPNGENKFISLPYAFDERPGLAGKFFDLQDNNQYTTVNYFNVDPEDPGYDNYFPVSEKECVSIDQFQYNLPGGDVTRDLVYCSGYALNKDTGKKDIYIKEIKNSIGTGEQEIREWIFGRNDTDEECLDIKIDPVYDLTSQVEAVTIICGGRTNGDLDLGGGQDTAYSQRGIIKMRYNKPDDSSAKKMTYYNFANGGAQSDPDNPGVVVDTWARFDILSGGTNFKQKVNDDGAQEDMIFFHGFVFRFTLNLSTHNADLLDSSEFTQFGGVDGDSSCESVSPSIKLEKNDLSDRSIYCAGSLNGQEAIVKLVDHGYKGNKTFGGGLGKSLDSSHIDHPNQNIKYTILNNSSDRLGKINSMKNYFFDKQETGFVENNIGRYESLYFFVGGKTNFGYPDPDEVSEGSGVFLVDSANSDKVDYDAFIGMLNYRPFGSNNIFFKNNKLAHIEGSLLDSDLFWINTLNNTDSVANYRGDDTCRDIIVLGDRGSLDNSLTTGLTDPIGTVDSTNNVSGIACAGYTKSNVSSNQTSFLESDNTAWNKGYEDAEGNDSFMWLVSVVDPDPPKKPYWKNDSIWTRQLHSSTVFNAGYRTTTHGNGNQYCESILLHQPAEELTSNFNPSVLVCGGHADIISMNIERNGMRAMEIKTLSATSLTALLWGVEFKKTYSSIDLSDSSGNGVFLKFFPSALRSELINAEASGEIDHNKEVSVKDPGSQSYSTCFDLIKANDNKASSYSSFTSPYYDMNASLPIYYCAGAVQKFFDPFDAEINNLNKKATALPFLFHNFNLWSHFKCPEVTPPNADTTLPETIYSSVNPPTATVACSAGFSGGGLWTCTDNGDDTYSWLGPQCGE